MQIEIPDETYQAIVAANHNVDDFVSNAVADALEKWRFEVVADCRKSAAALSESERQTLRNALDSFKGSLTGSSLDEISADRREGLR